MSDLKPQAEYPERRTKMSTYRSDVVGSLLRPQYLKEARKKREVGRIDPCRIQEDRGSGRERGD